MAGYYTEKRSLPLGYNPRFKATSSAIPGGSNIFEYSNPCRQTTTSYRTGRRSGASVNSRMGDKDLIDLYIQYSSRRFDTGHTFFTEKETQQLTHPDARASGVSATNVKTSIQGPLVPDYGIYGANPIPFSPIESAYRGAQMVADTIPTNPVTNVAQTLAEIKREGIILPGANYAKWLKSRTSFLRASGGEYLNVSFGWYPLISSLTEVAQTVLQTRKILEQLEKDSGKSVRRRRVLDEEVLVSNYQVVAPDRAWRIPTIGTFSSTYAHLFEGYPSLPRRSGPLERVDRVTEQYSFSAAYTYFFENGSDPFSKLKAFEQQANLLLGTRVLTPEVLWELTPWSWLSDYFFNFGDLMSNVTRFGSDGLVMRYGYLMRHSVSERIYTQNGVVFRGNTGPGPFSITLRLERKERVRATPFGFGLNPDGFTARQWAILGALGLTKAPKALLG